METVEKISIKNWHSSDRPREKLLEKGTAALSDSELIAIIIGSGNDKESAVELGKRILSFAENDLNKLGKLSVKDLMKFKGIGEAKAIGIVSAMELGKRRQANSIGENPKITSAEDVASYFIPLMSDLQNEEFWVLFLNRSNKIIGKSRISSGGVSGTVVDIRILFKKAIEHLASNIVVVHNHPSGNLKPSQGDIDVTRKLKASGELMDVVLLDHVIIAESGFFSFAEEGLI